MHHDYRTPGDKAMPASSAVYPQLLQSCGISTVLEYTRIQEKHCTVAIAKFRSFNILKSTTGSFSRNSPRIPAIITDQHQTKKTMNFDAANPPSVLVQNDSACSPGPG